MNKILCVAAIFVAGLCCMSCGDEEGFSYSPKPMSNNELKTILVQKGYQFNEDGKLLLDDLANKTTALDLSGTKLGDFSGLDLLPNLREVKLSDNGYGPVFDFSKLPAQITGIDLTGNDIYEYANLVKVVIEENGNETITNLHDITKLYLPWTAKDNLEEVVRFYTKNKEAVTTGTIDMKMEDGDKALQKYTTLRNVPDENLRTYLQNKFPNLFNGEQIDLAKHPGYAQKTVVLLIQAKDGVADFEGIQYIIQNPYWEGAAVALYSATENGANMPSVKVGKHVTNLVLNNLKMKSLDLSNAGNLFVLNIENVAGLSTLDLSHTIWGQREKEIEAEESKGSYLIVYNCPSLKEIKLPKKDGLKTCYLDIECLDALETLDISKLEMVKNLTFGNLPERFNLVYPALTVFYSPEGRSATFFSCSESTFKRKATKDFLDRHYTKGKGIEKLGFSSFMSCAKNEAYNWRKALKKKP